MPHHYWRNSRGLIQNDLPYREDYTARVFVKLNPNGATLEVVGAMFALTRERIRQIESRALKKLRDACEREGLTVLDFLRMNGVNLGYAKMEIWMD